MENAEENGNIAAATEEQAAKSDEQKSSIAVTEAEDEDITESQFGEIDESQMSEEIEEEGLYVNRFQKFYIGMSEIGDEKTEPVYGGCEGPNAMYVKLISSDGHEFIVKREHALISPTIQAMLSGPRQLAENETNEIHFKDIPSHVLEQVCMYFAYKARYTNSTEEIPEFPMKPEIAFELLLAADFLDC